MATTVQNIIDSVKWQSDLQNGGRLANADLIPFIDAAYKQAWETVVQAYEDYFVKKVTDFAIAGGVGANTFSLTSTTDFFKLRGIQRQNGTTFGPPLPTHEFNEIGAVTELSYRLVDDTVYFEPELSCAGTYRLWYIYMPADLTAVGDTIVDKSNGAVKAFIVDLVGSRVVAREEEDPSFLANLQATMLQRIKMNSGNRNAGRGKKIADVRNSRRYRFMTRTGYFLP